MLMLITLKAVCSIWLSRRKKISVCVARFHVSRQDSMYLEVYILNIHIFVNTQRNVWKKIHRNGNSDCPWVKGF